MYIQCCSNLGQFLIGMHCFNTGSLCYLSVDVFDNWFYFFIILCYSKRCLYCYFEKEESFFEYIYPVSRTRRVNWFVFFSRKQRKKV